MGASAMSDLPPSLPPLPPGNWTVVQPGLTPPAAEPAAPPPLPGFTYKPPEIPPPSATRAVPPEVSMLYNALGQAGNWLKGPALTTAVRGTGDLINTMRNPGAALTSPFATLISPEYEKRYQSTLPQPGTELGNTVFNATGIPEYQGQSGPERTLMAGGRSAVANAPFGLLGRAVSAVPAAIGAAGGALGQTVREWLPEGPWTERVATAASMAPAVVAGINAATAPRQAETPTAPELKTAGKTGFQATTASPVTFLRDPLVAGARDAALEAYQGGHDPTLMPQTESLIQQRLLNAPAALDFNEAHQIRKALDVIIDSNRTTPTAKGNPNEVALASGLKTRLDSYLSSLGQDPAHIVAGTPAEAAATAQTFQDALGNYAAAKRSDKIGGGLRQTGTGGSIAGSVQSQTEAVNSGWNYDNILRQRTRGFMENDRKMAGYTPEETAALNAVREGSWMRNRLRELSNLAGGGGGFGMTATGGIGGAAGQAALGPWGMLLGLVPPAVAMTLKGGQNALARSSLNAADQLVRQRSPLYQENLQNLPPRDLAVIQSILPGLLAPPAQPGTASGRGLLAQPEPPGGWIY
jgi:hypothetical protein